ncbi:MAG: T9SS type A sorting domain-containing protein [Bacteroidales bacterium]|nr:T9SS type A sorting domain-containing protein [Bacteroidales bacterium]
MRKKALSFWATVVVAVLSASAQTFTATNADGVAINYSVLSATDHTVQVEPSAYSGRVVIPGTVTYNGDAYTVVSIDTAFRGTGITYLSLPASVASLKLMALLNCSRLDTLYLASTAPVEVPTYRNYHLPEFIFYSTNSQPIGTTVVVPCGSLQRYRDRYWESVPKLTSPCAVPLTVVSSADSIFRFDSIRYNLGGNPILHYSNRDYEVGDTARIKAERIVFRWNWGSYVPRFGWFIGWADGCHELNRTFIVTRADTLRCIVDTFHYAQLSASRISTPVYQFGTLSYDGRAGNNYRFSDLGNQSTIYATALWVGSHDSLSYSAPNYSDTVSVAADRFFYNGLSDYFPGPLRIADATTDLQTTLDFNRVWHLTREMIDYHLAHFRDPGYTPAPDILTWPGNGPEGYATQLAPYFDADSDGVYNPLKGDYPLIRGDECVFSIFNDAFGLHGESQGRTLGIEVHAMTYAFHEPTDTALWNSVFVHYDIYNRSAADHPNTYFGAWTDFDLGNAMDDYIGCDVARGFFYAYNGNEQDLPGEGCFMGVPPAQGCAILGGASLPADGKDNPAFTIDDFSGFTLSDPLGNMGINGLHFGDGIADNERMGMTSFVYYNNSVSGYNSEPSRSTDYYNYMCALWKNNQHIKYGGDGLGTGTTSLSARFMFPGDSDPWHWGTDGINPEVHPNDWTEATAGNIPGDRRGIAGSGCFTFQASSRQQFDLAYTTGFGNVDVQSSVDALVRNVESVRRQFARDTTDSGRPFVYAPLVEPLPPVDTTGINGVETTQLQVTPNPTSGIITITVASSFGTLQLLDMTGRTLMAVPIAEGVATLDLSPLPQGIYLLRIGNATQRIVKR